MRTRLLIVALAGLPFAAAAAAEPTKVPVRKASQPTEEAVSVVVASAEEVRSSPRSEQQSEVPAKRERKARVSTCRCGGQTPGN